VEVCGANPSTTIFYLALPTRTALKGGVLDPTANKKSLLTLINIPALVYRDTYHYIPLPKTLEIAGLFLLLRSGQRHFLHLKVK
jgi:hypothetical protein